MMLWDYVRRLVGSSACRSAIFTLVLWAAIAAPGPVMPADKAQETAAPAADAKGPTVTGSPGGGGLSWELPGRVSIYDLQFGAAVFKDNEWKFLGNARRFSAAGFGKRLTLTVRFSYSGSRADIPLKFIVKLPDSRQYEETVHLSSRRGKYVYRFTVHRPSDFLGSGSVYLYYGFSIVDVLDFSILPGA